MHLLTTSGYGYSEQLCENIVDWFLTKFLPRHKLYIGIEHKELEGPCGFCDIDPNYGDIHRPRDFVIDLQSNLLPTTYTITLIHELVHLRQMVKGQIKYKSGRITWDNVKVTDMDYAVQPHEIEAFDSEWPLYLDYIWDTIGEWYGDD